MDNDETLRAEFNPLIKGILLTVEKTIPAILRDMRARLEEIAALLRERR
jgi:hypothetical protein